MKKRWSRGKKTREFRLEQVFLGSFLAKMVKKSFVLTPPKMVKEAQKWSEFEFLVCSFPGERHNFRCKEGGPGVKKHANFVVSRVFVCSFPEISEQQGKMSFGVDPPKMVKEAQKWSEFEFFVCSFPGERHGFR